MSVIEFPLRSPVRPRREPAFRSPEAPSGGGQRILGSYAQGRPLGRALLESALTTALLLGAALGLWLLRIHWGLD